MVRTKEVRRAPLAVAVSVAGTLALAVLVTACAAPAEPPTPSTEPGIDGYLAQARAGGAGPDQVAILERSVDTGQVTLADVSQAVEATVACIDEAGLGVSQATEILPTGLELPTYTYSPGVGQEEEEALALARHCMQVNSMYVEKAYQLQPSSVSLYDAKFDAVRPEIVVCLEGNGVAVDDDATNDEIAQLANELAFGMTDEELMQAAQGEDASNGFVIVTPDELGPDCLAFLAE